MPCMYMCNIPREGNHGNGQTKLENQLRAECGGREQSQGRGQCHCKLRVPSRRLPKVNAKEEQLPSRSNRGAREATASTAPTRTATRVRVPPKCHGRDISCCSSVLRRGSENRAMGPKGQRVDQVDPVAASTISDHVYVPKMRVQYRNAGG